MAGVGAVQDEDDRGGQALGGRRPHKVDGDILAAKRGEQERQRFGIEGIRRAVRHPQGHSAAEPPQTLRPFEAARHAGHDVDRRGQGVPGEEIGRAEQPAIRCHACGPRGHGACGARRDDEAAGPDPGAAGDHGRRVGKARLPLEEPHADGAEPLPAVIGRLGRQRMPDERP